MTEEKDPSVHHHREWKRGHDHGTSSAIYGMAFIGALVYFMIHATSFWGVVLGILKSIVWPAIVIYRLLEFLNM